MLQVVESGHCWSQQPIGSTRWTSRLTLLHLISSLLDWSRSWQTFHAWGCVSSTCRVFLRAIYSLSCTSLKWAHPPSLCSLWWKIWPSHVHSVCQRVDGFFAPVPGVLSEWYWWALQSTIPGQESSSNPSGSSVSTTVFHMTRLSSSILHAAKTRASEALVICLIPKPAKQPGNEAETRSQHLLPTHTHIHTPGVGDWCNYPPGESSGHHWWSPFLQPLSSPVHHRGSSCCRYLLLRYHLFSPLSSTPSPSSSLSRLGTTSSPSHSS